MAQLGGYTARVSREPTDPDWDDFVESSPQGHHAQTSCWGCACASIGWRPVRVVVSRAGEVVGGAQMVTHPMPGGGNVGFVHRGPVVADGDPDLAARVFDEILALGKANEVRYLVVQPPPAGHWMVSELKRRGFRRGAFDIDHIATMRTDLTADLDKLLAGMSSRRRANIRSAERSGVTVRRGSEADLPIFNRLKDLHSARLGYARRSEAYYTELWKAFKVRGHVELFIAEYSGEPVSALLAITHGDTCGHMEWPWSGEHGDLKPNELLQWEVIKWAKSEGYRVSDWQGIDVPVAEAVLSGREVPDDPRYSASQFKLRFGGQVVLDSPSYDYVYNPVLRLAYRCVPVRVMRSPWMAKLLSKFREAGS